ncbi:MAG: hypothetical protein ACQEP7_04845 [bacterium]
MDNKIMFFFIASVGLIFACGTAFADTPPVEPGFYGYPVDYERVCRPDFPFPDIEGVIVTDVDGDRFVGLAGMRRGDIIQAVSDTRVYEMDDIREILNSSRGETLTFTVQQLSPRFELRRRENPFYRPRKNPYRKYNFTVEVPTYTPPDPTPVVAGESKRFYHKLKMSHSPDTSQNRVFEDRSIAEEAGLEPCPIGFEGGGSVVGELMETSIDVSIQKEESSENGTTDRLPPELRRAADIILPLRLRRHIEPKIKMLESNKIIATSTPGGKFKISRGLWELMESEEEQLFLIAYLQAHFDLRHEPDPESRQYLYELFEEAINRTTGGSINFGQLSQMRNYSPGYFIYQRFVDKGYGSERVEKAFLFAQIYLKRAGYSNKGIKQYLAKIRDMEANPSKKWLDFLLKHPAKLSLEERIEKTSKLVNKYF